MTPLSRKPHFLLLPLPEQGHITPMLSLASRLAAQGCIVTFVKADKAPPYEATLNEEKHEYAETQEGPISPADAEPHLQFRTLPRLSGGASSRPIDPGSSLVDVLKHTVASLEERQGMVEKMVQDSRESETPIMCIVCDAFLCCWVINVAKRQAIQATMLVACAAFAFYMPFSAKLGKSEDGEDAYRTFIGGLMQSENARSEEGRKQLAGVSSWYMRQWEGMEEASHILVNSFKHLESFILGSLQASKLNFQFIGPCLPTWEDRDNVRNTKGDIMAKQAGCLHTEEHACLTWLDQQAKRSVLLVSFGSEAILEAEQVQEFAMGIEASGYGYLWVVRANAPLHNMPPDDFQERTRNVGMCASWVPQRKVLQHEAIGGFLTHCGWNSTLESVVYGVPMLCFPMNADQFLNAVMIHKHWKVGLKLGTSRNVVVSRGEVEEALKTLMGSHDLRQRAVDLQKVAESALLESQDTLASFVEDITRQPCLSLV
ncbi:hypothetical protein GOP47_0019921 [Adiantum capillus-veneris]|uniref:Glycosyltransferase n=1 Tax=Adiantum capillus-veneris TaxID=13818 RepID=A0A9D4UC07_ADICA|nr:hypothetical protein GOP47_0019921 [Adiantum capillus-veneris]